MKIKWWAADWWSSLRMSGWAWLHTTTWRIYRHGTCVRVRAIISLAPTAITTAVVSQYKIPVTMSLHMQWIWMNKIFKLMGIRVVLSWRRIAHLIPRQNVFWLRSLCKNRLILPASVWCDAMELWMMMVANIWLPFWLWKLIYCDAAHSAQSVSGDTTIAFTFFFSVSCCCSEYPFALRCPDLPGGRAYSNTREYNSHISTCCYCCSTINAQMHSWINIILLFLVWFERIAELIVAWNSALLSQSKDPTNKQKNGRVINK